MEESKSIEQLEPGQGRGPGGCCDRFRSIPIRELSVEQVRLLLVRDVGTFFLLDKATHLLEADVLADGDFYPGDLLSAVLNINKAYWHRRPDLAARLCVLLQQKSSLIRQAGHKKLCREVECFLSEQTIQVS